jgi:hypothetical protein
MMEVGEGGEGGPLGRDWKEKWLEKCGAIGGGGEAHGGEGKGVMGEKEIMSEKVPLLDGVVEG